MAFSKYGFKAGFSLLLLVLGFSHSTNSFAQAEFNAGSAQSFKLGETDLFPSIRIDYLANSNAFLNTDNPTKASDVTISPTLTWVADRRLFFVVGRYLGAYNASSEDALNYADHTFTVNANAELDSRKRLNGGVELGFGHEQLGTNLTQGGANEDADQVEYTRFEANGEFQYGAEGAKGNVVAGLELVNVNYTSRDDLTSGRSFLQFEPYAQFSYRLSGDTRLLTQLRFASVNFDNADRDRNDISILGGFQFAATGKTGGTFRAGVLQSQNKRSLRSDQTEFVFSANLFWEPTTFSRFTFIGSRSIDNEGSSLVVGNTVDSIRDVLTVRWNHTWSARVSHIAQAQSSTLSQACPDISSSIVSGLLEFNINIRRWLIVGVNGNTWSRDANRCSGDNASVDLDTERTRIGAHIRATL